MNWESAESSKGYDGGKSEAPVRLSPVGTLYDLSVSMCLSSLTLLLIGIFHKVAPPSLLGYFLWLGLLLGQDAKLLYLTGFPPEFFQRRSFWVEKFTMIISVALSVPWLLWFIFWGRPLDLWAFLLFALSMSLPSATFSIKLKKKLRKHSERDSIIDGFYNSSLIGRVLLGIGLRPLMKWALL